MLLVVCWFGIFPDTCDCFSSEVEASYITEIISEVNFRSEVEAFYATDSLNEAREVGY